MRRSHPPKTLLVLLLLAAIATALLGLSGVALAAGLSAGGDWWKVTPEAENPSPYYDSILYSEIAPRLREIAQASNRVQVEVIGQSAGGRDLFLVTISDPQSRGRFGQYKAIRQTMIRDPEHAQELIEKFGDFKVPVFINGSIHGNEYTGTDAAMRLIEEFAFSDSPEVMQVLENEILLVNVCQNPDGRVMGTRANANGFDVNRDFITQSQPETRATVQVLTEWNPMVFLDLHGFVNPMLLEPCTPPHNPNYEYDLYIKWALAEAEAMEASLLANTGFLAQIPFRDFDEGWDDWPPIFAPMYAMYHGAYGHTMETPYRDERGVDAHYWATWGALTFIAENREEMVYDQVEIFRRGFLGELQVPIPDEILLETPWEQYNDLTTIEFAEAYVIPRDAPLQQDPHAARRLVDFLIFNDVQVEKARGAFALNGAIYPKGTYVVWLEQPKRGLANTILWDGWDISYVPGLTMYDISGWSHPLLWGVTRAVADDALSAATTGIDRADPVAGAVTSAPRPAAYAYLPTSNEAVVATNALLDRGVTLYRSEEPFTVDGLDLGAGTFVLPADQANAVALANELANGYGLEVVGLPTWPAGLVSLEKQKVAVLASEGARFVLGELGFDRTAVTRADLDAGVLETGGYDVFVNSSQPWDSSGWVTGLSDEGKASVAAFVAAGGDYVGIGGTGVGFGIDAGLMTATYAGGTGRANGVVRAVYAPADPVAAQYPADSHGFVYSPLWFTSLGGGVTTSVSVALDDFFVSGYWPGWDTGTAAGSPIVVHTATGPADAEVTLMGLDPTFRAHPRLTYRLLANGIYNGLD